MNVLVWSGRKWLPPPRPEMFPSTFSLSRASFAHYAWNDESLQDWMEEAGKDASGARVRRVVHIGPIRLSTAPSAPPSGSIGQVLCESRSKATSACIDAIGWMNVSYWCSARRTKVYRGGSHVGPRARSSSAPFRSLTSMTVLQQLAGVVLLSMNCGCQTGQ